MLEFDQLLVYKLDRLGRETRLIVNAVAESEKPGVRVRSMTEKFDTGIAASRLMLTMQSGFASHERDVIRERSLGHERIASVWLIEERAHDAARRGAQRGVTGRSPDPESSTDSLTAPTVSAMCSVVDCCAVARVSVVTNFLNPDNSHVMV